MSHLNNVAQCFHMTQKTLGISKPYMSSLDMSEYKSRDSNVLSVEHFY